MKIVDTTFLIDIIRGNQQVIRILRKEESLLTTQINMFEVIRGIFLKNLSEKKYGEIMDLFETIHMLRLDEASLIKAAHISSSLTKKGIIISDNDCLIAGIALSHGITKIITNNKKHFERIKELQVETYES